MKYNECINAAELIIESGEVPLIIGESGIGKTSLIRCIAEDMNAELVNIDANLLKEGEIGGLPVVKDGITVYAPHQKLMEIKRITEEENKPVILFIDELNRCEHAVAQELMNLVLNREINGFKLNKKVMVAAAMNPSNTNDGFNNSSYEVTDLDPAQEDRFVWLRLDSDIQEWFKWAMGDGKIHEHIIEFLTEFPEYLHMPDSRDTVKPTPRSWERVSKAYDIYIKNKEKYSFETVINTVKGNTGSAVAADFETFIKNLKNPIIKPEELFEEDILSYELKKRIESENHSRLFIMAKNALRYLEKNNTERNITLFSEVLDIYPRDLRLGIMKQIKSDYSDALYKKFLDNDEFVEAFFHVFAG